MGVSQLDLVRQACAQFGIRRDLSDTIVGAAIFYLQSSRLISSELYYAAEWLFHLGRKFNSRCYFISMLVFLSFSFNFEIKKVVPLPPFRLCVCSA